VLPGCGAGWGFDSSELPFVGAGSQVVMTGATFLAWVAFFPGSALGFLAGGWEGGCAEGGLVVSGAG